jgi:hypothetical protein
MSIRFKDYIVGKQKEDGMKGAEAYAYARQMQGIRESNPLAIEKAVKLRYTVTSYACAFGSLWASIFADNITLGGWLAGIAFVIALYGDATATAQPLQR